MKVFLLGVVLFVGVAGVYGRNPNPCEGIPGTNRYRRDYSACSTYFWCNNGRAEHTIPCPYPYGFDEDRQLCTLAASTCSPCPQTFDCYVADPEDYDCRSYQSCTRGIRSIIAVTCALFHRFERASGLCELSGSVPCFIGPQTTPTTTTRVPITTPLPPTTPLPSTIPPTTTVPTSEPGNTASPTTDSTGAPSTTAPLTTVPQNVDYCDSSLCSLGRQHIACDHSGDFDPSCPPEREMVVITPHMQKTILDAHNEYRHLVANGSIAWLPTASRMTTLTWNDELAFFAELNVKQCRTSHDQCRNTRELQFVGQNLAWTPSFDPNDLQIRGVVTSWWNEHIHATSNRMESCCASDSGAVIANFNQLVTDRALQIGCAISMYRTIVGGVQYNSVMACNYAHGSEVTKPVYIFGPPASACESGTNPDFPGLCSADEQSCSCHQGPPSSSSSSSKSSSEKGSHQALEQEQGLHRGGEVDY